MLVFRGSLIDGPEKSIERLSGLSLTDDQWEFIFDNFNERQLLLECDSLVEIEEEEFEGGPGQSDTYYRYEADAPEEFKRELAALILEKLEQRP